MPSGKVIAAKAGRAYVRSTPTAPASTARFGVVPKDPDLARVQEDLRASGQNGGGAGGESPFKNGQLLEVDFNDGLNQELPHRLGGAVKGFVVVDKISNVAADIVRDDYTTGTPANASRAETHVKFRASFACKAKLWVWR